MMKERLAEKLKRLASLAATFLLIISTLLCIILIAKSVSGGNVSLFGYRLFYVLTGSMEPTIHTGSLILVKESPDGVYSEGDIITFKSKASEIYGQPNTHRIVKVVEDAGTMAYITQGDANNTADNGLTFPDEIYGKVVWFSGTLQWFGSVLAFLTTPVGFLLIVLLPILLITVSQLKDFTKTYKTALAEAAEQNMQLMNERNGQNERKQ